LEYLYDKRKRSSSSSDSMPMPSNQVFKIGDVNNAEPVSNVTEVELVDRYVQCLWHAAELMDAQVSMPSDDDLPITGQGRWTGRGTSTLKSRWNEWRRSDEKEYERQLRMVGISTLMALRQSANESSMQDYMRATLGALTSKDNPRSFNLSRVMERVQLIPAWLPSPLLPYIIAASAVVAKDDIQTIRDRVLAGSGFFVTGTESIPSAALFRGNIRVAAVDTSSKNVSAVVFEEIQRRLQVAELSDRVQLFLIEDLQWKPRKNEPQPRPVILALSKLVVPDDRLIKKKSVISKLLRSASSALSILAVFAYSVNCFALNPQFFNSLIHLDDARVLVQCLPVFLGVFALQAVGEGVRWLVARYRNIRIGLPLPLPSGQIGTFGCITPFRSFPSNRSTMIDVSLSGHITIFLLSVALMIFGISATLHSSEAALASFPHVPVALLKSSFMVGSIVTFVAPKLVSLPLAQPVPIHPLFIIGFSGILASSLNLLPMFRLDGGRACTAALGNRIGAIASVTSLLFLLSTSLASDNSGLAFAWGMIIVIFRRKFEIPARDEVTPVDKARLGVWIAALLGALLTLAPFPGGYGLL
jgi:membrane-associated protease RseP (regulator of RpoE activity)